MFETFKNLLVEELQLDESTITMEAEINGEAVTRTAAVTVCEGVVTAVDAKAETASLKPNAQGTPILVTLYDLGGAAMDAVPEGVKILADPETPVVVIASSAAEDSAASAAEGEGPEEPEVITAKKKEEEAEPEAPKGKK